MDNMTIAENTNSYTVTGLSGIDNYNVTVTANNSCGMMMSDPITVYGRNIIIRTYVVHTYLRTCDYVCI